MITKEWNCIHLEQIASSGQCFRWKKTGEGRFLIPAFGRVLQVRQITPVMFEADCSQQEWKACWADYFDEQTDYDAVIASIPAQDTYLSAAAAYGRGIRILRQPLWETIASFIISQNNNIPRIRSIITRLSAGELTPFPQAETMLQWKEAELRAAGLGYRAPYLHKAARMYLTENAPERLRTLCYPQAREYLMRYPGIGPKVADCICLFGLGHKGAFPMDVWVKRILATHYPQGFRLERYPHTAGILQQYMFYYERTLSERNGRKASVVHKGAQA